MKKYSFLFFFLGILVGTLTSCSDEDGNDPYIPTPPEVTIRNLSGKTTCLPGETVELKAKLDNHLVTTLNWFLNGEKVSVDSVYRFTSDDLGSFKVVLTATNADGIDSDSLILEVSDGKFHFSNIKNWTGEGENSSILAIQWVTGDNLLEPADDEVFFIAWGYRWKSTESPLGIDMMKAVAKKDPRLYVVRSGSYIVGLAYDGNNDGRIELQNDDMRLTQDDFTEGWYELPGGGNFDGIKPVDPEDYWMGGLYDVYATYWLGAGEVVPEADDFEYSSLFVFNRPLENFSWDVWTLSPINNEDLVNTLPIPRLIQAAEANE